MRLWSLRHLHYSKLLLYYSWNLLSDCFHFHRSWWWYTNKSQTNIILLQLEEKNLNPKKKYISKSQGLTRQPSLVLTAEQGLHCWSFMMPLCWLGPRHVAAACHVGFSTKFASSNSSTTGRLGRSAKHPSAHHWLLQPESQKIPLMKLWLWECCLPAQCLWTASVTNRRIVISIWRELGLGVAWQCPIEYLCTQQLKVNGNPVKTLRPIKVDVAEWVISASSHSRIQYCTAAIVGWKKKNKNHSRRLIRALSHGSRSRRT